MQIIGVIDLAGGRAVHAVAGARERYQPLVPRAFQDMDAGDADALARWYVETLGITALYVADLDAIQGRAPQDALVARLCQHGVPVSVDAGISTPDAARSLLLHGAASVIVPLETLPSFDALQAICDSVGGDRVIFSLDLKQGTPIAAMSVGDQTAHAIAARAAAAGVRSVIVLDLARVGTGTGLDLDLIARVRSAIPRSVSLLAGGGVRGWADLERLAAAGCDAALVATALQDGRLGARDVRRARELGRP